ncbi:flagellar FlbD family protein [Arthrobacter mobilis]|uniref:Flagellar FlbD family protein n=1 Tax=Arthrobacter mobilis TaxID=2724944 RepID=A0A7X6HAR9_9MICC|nr:flagellar FlbD family protein [Arthrobacter mobilis]NKX53629.1 flagellar FlbD family protein [Arthrobacter mobilis]
MIVVTRLNESRFAVNPDLIERIHASPDTTLVMVDGARYIVTETMEEVIEMIAGYRAYVLNLAREMPAAVDRHGHPQLGLVPPAGEQPGLQPGGAGPAGKTVPLRPRNK